MSTHMNVVLQASFLGVNVGVYAWLGNPINLAASVILTATLVLALIMAAQDMP